MGYFGVGVYHPKFGVNVGTLIRSAEAFGASFVFTVGRRYEPQSSDVTNATARIPLYHYKTIEELREFMPVGCPLVGIELTDEAVPLPKFEHYQREVLLAGAEDHGLPPKVLAACHKVISIPGASKCLNVATAGTIVMYDRYLKGTAYDERRIH